MTKPKRRPLTERQREFVRFYLGECSYNATEAAKRAGYKHAQKTSYRLLANAGIQEEIRRVAAKAESKAVSTFEERQKFLTNVMRGEEPQDGPADMKDRLKAVELLGKTHGDFVKKVELEADPHEALRTQMSAILESKRKRQG